MRHVSIINGKTLQIVLLTGVGGIADYTQVNSQLQTKPIWNFSLSVDSWR